MNRYELYEQNVLARYGRAKEDALQKRRVDQYRVNSDNPYSGLAVELERSGHGPTGPVGMYGITQLDNWVDDSRGFIGLEIALLFGKKLLKRRPKTKVLTDIVKYRCEIKSHQIFNCSGLELENNKDGLEKISDILVDDYLEGMKHRNEEGFKQLI